MAGVLRFIPRIRAFSLSIARCSAVMATRSLTGPSMVKSSLPTQSKLLMGKQTLIKTQVRMMSADPDCEEEVRERVLTVLNLYDKINPALLTLGSHFMKDLGLDSLDHVEIIVAIENDFGFEIPDNKAELLLTPQEIIEYICDEFDVDG